MATVKNDVKGDIKRLDKAIKSALQEIANTGIAELQNNVAVDTGNLRRSHAYEIDNQSKVVTWGVNVNAPYGIELEFKQVSKGGRPWFRQTLRRNKKTFKEIANKHLKGVNND